MGLVINEIDVLGMEEFERFAIRSIQNPGNTNIAFADWVGPECDITPEEVMKDIEALGRISGTLANQKIL